MLHAKAHLLEIQKKVVHAQGIEIQVIPQKSLTSLQEITKAVYDLLFAEREEIFIILPLHDANVLRYWFVTGFASHGHIGEVIILRKNIPEIDLSELDATC